MLHTDHNNQQRTLFRKGPDASYRKLFAPMSSRYPLVPRDKWVTIDRRAQWAVLQWILDQMQHGSCVGFSGAGALMRSRALAGMAFQRLSGSYVYSWVNGGRDQGASITDAMGALQVHGTCLDTTCPVNSIYRNQSKVGDTEAQRFRLAAGYTIDDSDQASAFDWIMSAVQTGLIPQFAIEVGNNFENFSKDGVAGFSAGYGNHSVLADGALLINGVWYLLMCNSWGFNWGPFRNGYVLLSEKHIMGPVNAGGQDAFVHLDETTDPQDTTSPHVPA